MYGTGFFPTDRASIYRDRRGRPVPGRHLRGAAGRAPRRADPRRGRPAAALRRRLDLLPPRGRRRRAATPAASSACTSSTRSRCSRSCCPRTRPPSTSASSACRRRSCAAIEVPYRVIDIAVGDLGASAARKFDCEAWMPAQGGLPRGHLLLELHRLPGPPPAHPRAPRVGHRDACTPSTAPPSRSAARSSRSSRTTSARTARSRCPPPCVARGAPAEIRPAVSAATRPRVAVVGHSEWVTHGIGPMPRPGEITYLAEPFDEPAGGGGVSAAQVAKLGAECLFFTALGDDDGRSTRAAAALRTRASPCSRRVREAPQTRAVSAVGADGDRAHRGDRRADLGAHRGPAALGRPGRLRRRLLHRSRLGHGRRRPPRPGAGGHHAPAGAARRERRARRRADRERRRPDRGGRPRRRSRCRPR